MNNAYHIATNKKLANQIFGFFQNEILVVFDEVLSEGPIQQEFASDEFWKLRYEFYEKEKGISKLEYFDKTIKELLKIEELTTEDEVTIWLENTLICQLNFLAICTFLLQNYRKDISYNFIIVKNKITSENEFNKERASKLKLTRSNLLLASACWKSVSENNSKLFESQNISKYPKFRKLEIILQSYFKKASNATI